MSQRTHLTLEHRLQATKHAFNTPAAAVQLGDVLGAHPLRGNIRQQADERFSIFRGFIQVQFDSPQRHLPSCLIFNLDGLLEDNPCLHSPHLLQRTHFCRVRRTAMLADDEGGLLVMDGHQNPHGREVPVGQPQLSWLYAGKERPHQGALLRMGILGRQDVHHLVHLWRIHHQGLPGQGRSPEASQRLEPLLAGGQVVAIQHAHPVAPGPRLLQLLHRLDHGRKPLSAALYQRSYHLRLGMIDLVVQGCQRHPQLASGLCRRMQRRAQAQGHQHHQLHHGGEKQLSRVLLVAVLLENLVDPFGTQRPLQDQPCHDSQGAFALKALEDVTEHHAFPPGGAPG